ncbi:MAG TPA: tryptophan synthase subunit alpha, partial [Candidatus Nitrosocosmicus sp.]|nr:tryptophan synthase subunit alpha [Candidatus Nitrosocosmicus sp.]
LCVDLPPEEGEELKRWTDAEGLDLIFLLSPASGKARLELVARKARGFIYYVSVTGVTGARRSLDERLRSQIAQVRRMTSIPVGVGFGISTPQQAAWIVEFADAVVIGSALVETIERASGSLAKAQAAGDFVSKIKRAMKRSRSNGRKR